MTWCGQGKGKFLNNVNNIIFCLKVIKNINSTDQFK